MEVKINLSTLQNHKFIKWINQYYKIISLLNEMNESILQNQYYKIITPFNGSQNKS